MPLVGALTGGAGAVTTINQNFAPEYILIGDTQTDLPITNFSFAIGGQEKTNIIGQALIQAYSKLEMEGLLGASVKVGQLLRVADGGYGNQAFQARFTNAGATTPNIYFFSERKGSGQCIGASNIVVQASSYETFENFAYLIFDATNLDVVDIVWEDPAEGTTWTEKLAGVELAALFATEHITDANGLLIAMTVVNNVGLLTQGAKFIRTARLYAAAGGAVTVTSVGIQQV